MAGVGAHLADLTLELCRIPSVTGDEAAIAAEVARRCVERLGPERTLRVGNAVLCAPAPRPGLPTVALLGHLDTVRPAAAQPLGVRDGRVFGCGASDMKGGVAVMLALLERAEGFIRANLRCVFYDREEGPADESGILPLLVPAAGHLHGIDVGFCLEPTDNRLEAGCLGGLHATVTFRGRRAHSARPWQGHNAIYAALPYLQRLAAFGRREVRLGELTYYEVMNATMARTDNSRNVVPDRFLLNVNYRFAPGKPLAIAEEQLLALVGGAAEVQVIDRAPAGAVCLDHPLIAAFRAELGLAVAAKQAWTDVARLTEQGIAAVNFGPGETALAHQANESISIEALVRSHDAFLHLLT